MNRNHFGFRFFLPKKPDKPQHPASYLATTLISKRLIRFLSATYFSTCVSVFAGITISAGDLILKSESTGIVFLRKSDLYPLGQVHVGAAPLALQTRGNIIYAACGQAGLNIVDFANSSEPKILANYGVPSAAIGLSISGERCYVAERSGALLALNIANPTNVSLIWRSESAGENFGFAVVGLYAYLAKGAAGIEIRDISGLQNSTLVKIFATGDDAFGLQVSGGFAYVACGAAGFKTFDIREPLNPRELSALTLPGTSTSVSLLDQIVAVSAGEGGLHLIDVTDPTTPLFKKTIAGNILSAHTAVAHEASQGAKVIFDCDPGADIDDVGDLAVLHQLANNGELQILGTTYSMRPDFGAPIIEVVNRAYGRPDMPIAVSKTSPWDAWDVYGSPLQNNFYHAIGSSRFAPDAVPWYRQTLSAAEDHSISIVVAGQLRNMYDLWRSPADAISPLSGRQLMIQKIERLIFVAGIFPDGYEFNMFVDPIAAQVANEWNGTDLPVSFVGIENGNNVLIGGSVLKKPINDPVRMGYLLFYNAYQANVRPAWAGLGLLFAARGYESNGTPLFRAVKGSITVSSGGNNAWTNQPTSNMEYLRNEQSDSYYAAILDSLLIRPPFENAEPRVYSVDDAGNLSIWNIKDAATPVLVNQYKPPRLRWTSQSGSIEVFWDSQLTGYSLWTASTPLGPWQPVSGLIETIGDQKRHSIPVAGEQYFQLRR